MTRQPSRFVPAAAAESMPILMLLSRPVLGLLSGTLLSGCVTTSDMGSGTSGGRWDRALAVGSVAEETWEAAPPSDEGPPARVGGVPEDGGALAATPGAARPRGEMPAPAGTESGQSLDSSEPPAAATEEPKLGWLPWGRAKRQREAERAQEEEERLREMGPRISEPKAQAWKGDQIKSNTGLTPSELGRWQRDPRKAMETARENRRMVFLWMTDSKRSAPSRVLADELFRHTQFLRLAKQYFELARVDFGETDIRSHSYAQKLKETLNVNGFPTLILFEPDGEEVWRRSGYRRGRYGVMLGELKGRTEVFALNEKRRRDRLDDEGYRTWTNAGGRALYAKAVDVSREEKRVTLREPSGEEHDYSVLKLSDADRDWLAATFLQEPPVPAE